MAALLAEQKSADRAGALLRFVQLDSDAAAGVTPPSAGERQSARLLKDRLEAERADRALLHRTTISIAEPFEGLKDVTASVRHRQRVALSWTSEPSLLPSTLASGASPQPDEVYLLPATVAAGMGASWLADVRRLGRRA